MSLKVGHGLRVIKNGDRKDEFWTVKSDPTTSGDIPKVLVLSSKEKLPRFVHLFDDKLITDDNGVICDFRDGDQLSIET